ncbi:MAG TPA: hypothetical protein VE891_12195 [Allosphingosinicella sp.]|nr:hypothetical protein [Allosphingosinicella sp.]
MSDSISWSFNAIAASGATGKVTGKTPVDAVMVASKTVKKGDTADLGLQLETANKVIYLSITSTSPEVTVKVGTGAGAKTVTMTGPLVLHGDAVKLLSDDLGKVTVTGPTSVGAPPADVSILIGFNLA